MAKTDPKALLRGVAAEVGAGRTPRPPRRALAARTSLVADAAAGGVQMATHRRVDPASCRMWDRHNRRYDLVTEAECADLIASIDSQDGQRIPAIVRELAVPEGPVRFEVIAGARRHFAVSALHARGREVGFLVEVQDLSDEAAFRVSDLENRERSDISDYERGQDYAQALMRYYQGNQRRMAAAIGLDEKALGRFVALSRVPPLVTDLVADVRALKRDHAEKLLPLLGDAGARPRVEARAAEMADGRRRPAPYVVAELVKAGSRPKGRGGAAGKRVVRREDGSTLASVEVSARSVVLRVPRRKGMDADALEAALLEALRRADGSGDAA